MRGDSQRVYPYLTLQLCVSARIKQNLYCLPMTFLAGYIEGCGTILDMGNNITTSHETSVRETHPLPLVELISDKAHIRYRTDVMWDVLYDTVVHNLSIPTISQYIMLVSLIHSQLCPLFFLDARE